MDSTFLGVLAGIALELRKRTPKGSLVLARMGQRNLELIRNLGLHQLLTVDTADAGREPRGVRHAAGRRRTGASWRTPASCSRPTRTLSPPTSPTGASSRTCSFS